MQINPKINIYQYNNLSNVDKSIIGDLLTNTWSDVDPQNSHFQQTNAQSFCATLNGTLIGYCAICSWNIIVEDETYRMGWLNHVCTDCRYRGQGVGRALVEQAARWVMEGGRFDIGLFVCESQNTIFYRSVDYWSESSDLVLKESDREGAYRSDELNLNVFKLLISPKAKLHAAKFENATIVLNFPEGMFI